MENKFAEPVKHELSASKRLRDRIAAFHDKHLKVASLSEHVVDRFGELVPEVSSEKGKKVVEWLRPKIADIAKDAEVAVAVVDVTLGVVAGGLGVAEGARVAKILHPGRLREKMMPGELRGMSSQGSNADVIAARKPMLGVIGGGVASGVFLGLRPMTRLMDAVYSKHTVSLSKRVVRWVDGILLRQEQKAKDKHPVYFGSAKA